MSTGNRERDYSRRYKEGTPTSLTRTTGPETSNGVDLVEGHCLMEDVDWTVSVSVWRSE